MPGVPSSRGCNACRQQKKKCDQLTPLCSRCARLGIPCVGSGERRYKFMATAAHTASLGSGKTPTVHLPPPKMQLATSPRVVVPSNPTSLDTMSLVSALQVTDVRFDLRIYGPFFTELPRRLGRNPALDASVHALTVSIPAVHTHQFTPDMFQAYGDALRHLRTALRDPTTAGSVETICAVYLIMICQGWIGRGGDFGPSHGEAMAHMLNNAAGTQNWHSEFEAEVTNTLLVIVLLESFGNPKIKLDPRLWASTPAIPRPSRPRISGANEIESLSIQSLAAVSGYTRNVQGSLPDIQLSYQVLRHDLVKMKALLLASSAKHVHARRQTGYGTLLLLGLMANWALTTFKIGDQPTLESEKVFFIDEIMELAQEASQYRPLAASAMPGFIMAAKETTDETDTARRTRLEELLVLYQSDFPAAKL